MTETLLDEAAVLAGYDAVAALYPHVPSLSHWRAWEHAAYQRFTLPGRVLDLGCGDGEYFRLLWPNSREVVGVDASADAVQSARRSGVYTEVHHAFANKLPIADASVDSVFANCSLEHMDNLDLVLTETIRCLLPGGTVLCSVVTDKFLSWAVIPLLLRGAGGTTIERRVVEEFVAFHHLVNPLTTEEWRSRFIAAGFVVMQHVPIVPRYNSGLFLLVDGAWHVGKPGGGEIGDDLYPELSSNPRFTEGFRLVVQGALRMESDWRTCSGAVFELRKPGHP